MVTWQGRRNIPIFSAEENSSSNPVVVCSRAGVLIQGSLTPELRLIPMLRLWAGRGGDLLWAEVGGRAGWEVKCELWADRIDKGQDKGLQ